MHIMKRDLQPKSNKWVLPGVHLLLFPNVKGERAKANEPWKQSTPINTMKRWCVYQNTLNIGLRMQRMADEYIKIITIDTTYPVHPGRLTARSPGVGFCGPNPKSFLAAGSVTLERLQKLKQWAQLKGCHYKRQRRDCTYTCKYVKNKMVQAMYRWKTIFLSTGRQFPRNEPLILRWHVSIS